MSAAQRIQAEVPLRDTLYYGKPCRHGHNGVRYKKTNECLECKRAHHRNWKKSENGKKSSREWMRKQYVAHPLPKVPELTIEEKRARDRHYSKKQKPKRQRRWREDMEHLKRYGLSKEDYLAMAEVQGFSCAICGTRPELTNCKRRLLCVDHDHGTGKIRGLLCDECNKGIGNLHEDQAIIFKALLYLRRHQSG